MCLLTSSNEFLRIVPHCTFRPRRTNAGGKCFINKIPKTQINNVNIVNEICYKNIQCLISSLIFIVPTFLLQRFDTKYILKKWKRIHRILKPHNSVLYLSQLKDWFIITENRTQFICIYILGGFYLDSLDIIVVFG